MRVAKKSSSLDVVDRHLSQTRDDRRPPSSNLSSARRQPSSRHDRHAHRQHDRNERRCEVRVAARERHHNTRRCLRVVRLLVMLSTWRLEGQRPDARDTTRAIGPERRVRGRSFGRCRLSAAARRSARAATLHDIGGLFESRFIRARCLMAVTKHDSTASSLWRGQNKEQQVSTSPTGARRWCDDRRPTDNEQRLLERSSKLAVISRPQRERATDD